MEFYKKIIVFFFILITTLTVVQKTHAGRNECSGLFLAPFLDELSLNVSEVVIRDGTQPVPNANARYNSMRSFAEYLVKFEHNIYSPRDSQLSLIKELKGLTSDDLVVDFGCGEGYAIEQLISTPAEVFSGFENSYYFKKTMKESGTVFGVYEHLRRNFDPTDNKLLLPNTPKSVWTDENHNQQYAYFWLRAFEFINLPSDKKPSVLGITYEMHRTPPQNQKVNFMRGRLLENIPTEEIPMFKLGVSLFGVPSYTKKLDVVLRKIGSRMLPGAKFFVYGATAKILGKHLLPETADESESISIEGWIEGRAKGFKVRRAFGFFVLERTDEPLFIPDLRVIRNYNDSVAPPHYLFHEI